jgi:hypothetical protein
VHRYYLEKIIMERNIRLKNSFENKHRSSIVTRHPTRQQPNNLYAHNYMICLTSFTKEAARTIPGKRMLYEISEHDFVQCSGQILITQFYFDYPNLP